MSGRSKAGKLLDHLTGSSSTKYVLNQIIGEYGRLSEFRIDRSNKTISASLLLNGENQLIELYIKQYAVVTTDRSTSLLIKEAESGKPWLNAVLRNFVVNRPWHVPDSKAAFFIDLLG